MSCFPVGKREARQRDHGVATPIAEPVIAGDDGLLISAGNDVLVGGGAQVAGKVIVDGGGQNCLARRVISAC